MLGAWRSIFQLPPAARVATVKTIVLLRLLVSSLWTPLHAFYG